MADSIDVINAVEDKVWVQNLSELAIKKFGRVAQLRNAELFVYKSTETEIEIERDKIKFVATDSELGFSIRVLDSEHRIGFAFSTRTKDLEKTIERAIKNARLGRELPNFEFPQLLTTSKLPTVPDLYDKKLVELEFDEIVSHATELITGAKSKSDKIVVTSGGVSTSYELIGITNSVGLELIYDATCISASVYTILESDSSRLRGGQQQPTGFDYKISRKLTDIDWYQIGERASELAILTKAPVKFGVPIGKLPVIFKPDALAPLAEYILAYALEGERACKHESFYADKLNHQVADEKLTVVDDQLLPSGLNSAPVDDEGMISKKLILIEHGILKQFVFDVCTGSKYNEASTSNAIRAVGYKSPPKGKLRNLVLVPSSRTQLTETLDKLIETTSHGIIVHEVIGMHTANPVTGEFGVTAPIAFEIKHGELKHALKPIMIAGNFFELLKNIDGIASDYKHVAGGYTPTVCYIPSVKFGNVTIATAG